MQHLVLQNMNMTAQQAMREIWGGVSPDCSPDNYDFIVADVLTRAAAAALTRQIDIVFDAPPGPNSGRFVEVEDEAGRSVDVGIGSKETTNIGRSGFRSLPPLWDSVPTACQLRQH